jgi:hypothetical protein
MKTEYYFIFFLLIVLIFLFIFMIRRINRLKKQADEYKRQVIANIKKTIPYGERLLIRSFLKLFKDSTFAGFTVYNHLELETTKGFKQVDFLIVSPQGLFVIESKRWKGVTYIYRDYNYDLFQNTEFSAFGVRSSERIRVFNAQQDDDSDGKIKLSAYNNPIAQAREYSKHLSGILNFKPVKNIVVFSIENGYSVLYNHEALGNITIDTFTSLITNVHLKEFFVSLPQENIIDNQSIIEAVDKLPYKFKLDSSNYQQAPFESI